MRTAWGTPWTYPRLPGKAQRGPPSPAAPEGPLGEGGVELVVVRAVVVAVAAVVAVVVAAGAVVDRGRRCGAILGVQAGEGQLAADLAALGLDAVALLVGHAEAGRDDERHRAGVVGDGDLLRGELADRAHDPNLALGAHDGRAGALGRGGREAPGGRRCNGGRENC